MRHTLIITLLLTLTVTLMAARTLTAVFGWAETTRDFGRIPPGKPVTAEFVFTNRGDVPLLIADARGSCGCTGVDFPREAVLPGASGSIRATFNAAAPGAFNKSVIVTANADGGPATLLLRGEVVSSVPAP
jgi:hypothetical protein